MHFNNTVIVVLFWFGKSEATVDLCLVYLVRAQFNWTTSQSEPEYEFLEPEEFKKKKNNHETIRFITHVSVIINRSYGTDRPRACLFGWTVRDWLKTTIDGGSSDSFLRDGLLNKKSRLKQRCHYQIPLSETMLVVAGAATAAAAAATAYAMLVCWLVLFAHKCECVQRRELKWVINMGYMATVCAPGSVNGWTAACALHTFLNGLVLVPCG